jgi:hypothetical protein
MMNLGRSCNDVANVDGIRYLWAVEQCYPLAILTLSSRVGIMLGYVADLSFYKIADTPSIVGLVSD